MDFIRIWRLFFKALDLIERENKSATMKWAHSNFLLLWRFTMYLGVFLQDIALFIIVEREAIPSTGLMAFATSKILVKSAIFLIRKCKITQMWHHLNDQAIKAKNIDEMM